MKVIRSFRENMAQTFQQREQRKKSTAGREVDDFMARYGVKLPLQLPVGLRLKSIKLNGDKKALLVRYSCPSSMDEGKESFFMVMTPRVFDNGFDYVLQKDDIKAQIDISGQIATLTERGEGIYVRRQLFWKTNGFVYQMLSDAFDGCVLSSEEMIQVARST